MKFSKAKQVGKKRKRKRRRTGYTIAQVSRMECGDLIKSTQPALDKALWFIFSLYVRIRDSRNGLGWCVTCPRVNAWQKMDAGHYIGRKNNTVKYNEINVHVQCKHCNAFHQGRSEQYAEYIKRTYGDEAHDKLVTLSQTKSKLTRLWYADMIQEYVKKLLELAKEKGESIAERKVYL